MQGKIKKVMSERGYGFITQDGSDEDLFFHQSNLEGSEFYQLREGMPVEFEVGEGRKGPEAIKIKVQE